MPGDIKVVITIRWVLIVNVWSVGEVRSTMSR